MLHVITSKATITCLAIGIFYPGDVMSRYLCSIHNILLLFFWASEHFWLESNFLLLRGVVGKLAKVVTLRLLWLYFIFLVSVFWYSCIVLNNFHIVTVSGVALWQTLTCATKLCSNCLFQVDSGFLEDCSCGGMSNDVYGDWNFKADTSMYRL